MSYNKLQWIILHVHFVKLTFIALCCTMHLFIQGFITKHLN